MSQFKKNLESLPSIENIERLELMEENNAQPVAIIENKPGKAGSLAVYNSLKLSHGDLTAESAKTGLELFAEHVASAKATPGAHPNIDLLLDVVEKNRVLSIRLVDKTN